MYLFLWHLPIFLFSMYRGSLPRVERLVYDSPPPSLEMMTDWSYTFPPPPYHHGVDNENCILFLYLIYLISWFV